VDGAVSDSRRDAARSSLAATPTLDYGSVWEDVVDAVLPLLRGYREALAALASTTKADGTLVTEADLAVQSLIVRTVLRHDPAATFVAEEPLDVSARPVTGARVWVIDPIDGTSQYVRDDGVEFCSVVAVLERGVPAGCLILAPELGRHRVPVILTVAGRGDPPRLNGEVASAARRTDLVSVTRSSRAAPSPLERAAIAQRLSTKTRSTSLTLDMARTVLDLEPATGLPSFRWFAASEQLVWDACAGMSLAIAAGMPVAGHDGASVTPVGPHLLAGPQPRLASVLLARPADLAWLVATHSAGG
jgi:3'(2'), 5'-bisphosphate nucleotidase